MVFNFKDVDSINFNTLDNFIILLKSAFKYDHVKISLIFNINTNLSNIEKIWDNQPYDFWREIIIN